jgi:N utilization substance protein A
MKTIDMKIIRYLNLFEQVTGVRTKNCFYYNMQIVFAVPARSMSKSIGTNGNNVRRLNSIIGKKVKIVSMPEAQDDAFNFISSIVNPIKFKNLEMNNEEIIINAGQQSKASLIGRNKARLEEMKEIVKEYFNKNLRIV